MHTLYICFVHSSYMPFFKNEGEAQAPQTRLVCAGRAGGVRSRAALLEAGDLACFHLLHTNQPKAEENALESCYCAL